MVIYAALNFFVLKLASVDLLQIKNKEKDLRVIDKICVTD
jgi:hypothetical protein